MLSMPPSGSNASEFSLQSKFAIGVNRQGRQGPDLGHYRPKTLLWNISELQYFNIAENKSEVED
ncbi:hypothetical protein E2562_004751 [Oryza meyeriana var. granulata]|uniref:Uncharacterized protein n=1 Tax=Oryza meyeriana var. granulata TaxID=110450 RepID=A0A6G1DG99_9ORYZ|nr:hypothetical protein E2562_004751 [Oryza meyeriana var. granulata]